jgi:hypothetical protein
MSRTAWLRIGGVCTVAVFLVTGNYLFGWLMQSSQDTPLRYPGPAHRLVVHLSTGSLDISPGAAGQITGSQELSWSVTRPKVKRHWDPARQTLTLDVVCHGQFGLTKHCSAHFTLFVPADVSVQVDTGRGDISVHDLRGALALSSEDGDIYVGAGSGSLTASSMSGNVTVQDSAAATVSATSVSGSVDAMFARPPTTVLARSTAGNVNVGVPRSTAYAVSATGQDVIHDPGAVQDTPGAARTITAASVYGNVWVDYRS